MILVRSSYESVLRFEPNIRQRRNYKMTYLNENEEITFQYEKRRSDIIKVFQFHDNQDKNIWNDFGSRMVNVMHPEQYHRRQNKNVQVLRNLECGCIPDHL